MAWFDELKAALPAFYPGGPSDTIVGYLKGNSSPTEWRSMEAQGYQQMLILGTTPPTLKDWEAAGVAQRGAQATIQISQLAGFIILYGGFVYRPWGKIFQIDDDALNIGFPSAIQSWKRNYKGFRSAP
jgi:hypothetical protein